MRRPSLAFCFLAISFLVGCGGGALNPPSDATAPVITAQPTSQTVTVGDTATFSVAATGTAPLSYQWQKGTTWIAGATSSTYTTPVTTMADNGAQFHVLVTNLKGNMTSVGVTLTVDAAAVAPAITTQPANKTVTAGQTATFSVTATGTAPLTYQWQKGTTNIAGATSSSYTTPVTTVGDSGSTYRVVVSNSVSSATSSAATLTVNAAVVMPSITVPPASVSVTAGQTATFSVTATGTAPLSYQWQKSTTNIAGATSASYTTPVTVVGDSGSTFRVIVSNTAGNATSSAATLTVTAAPVAPSITLQPADKTVTAGQTATFSVLATGTAPLSFQWQKGGVNIGGATSASYTTPATTLGDSGAQFRVVVTNSVSSVTSNIATLTVNPAPVAPSITTPPASTTVTAGQTATFTVVAAGTAPLSYQWQKGTTNIAGATSSSYTTPATVIGDNGSTFRVVVTNSVSSVTSAAATLTVNAAPVAPSITTQPTNKTVTAGQTATFTVVAAGTAPLSYQWQKNTADIPGATSTSYTTPATVIGDDGSQFRVVVTNSVSNITSNAATLTVNAPVGPSITTQPADKTVNAGQTATFTVVAAGTAPLSYQWQKDTVNIAGATSTSYTTPATTVGDSGTQFRVVVTNTVSNITSNAATLTVNAVTAADVLTYHNDNARTGQNLNETILTTSNVNSAQFGKLANYSVDGRVDAQPLYASNVAIPSNGTHNLLIIATEHDSVYALDADTGTQIWKKSMLLSGESPSDDRGCGQVSPEIGVTATPVIDRSRGPNGAIYVVAMSKNGSTYHHRLHALDLATGAELFGGPQEITASYPGTGAGTNGTNVIFDPKQYKERVGLLLMNGVLYTAWASHCDIDPYTGWVMGHNADTLARTTVVNVVPNGNRGAIWMAGAGLAADNSGNIYFLDGNGDFGTALDGSGHPINKNYGNGFIKLSTTGGNLAVADYFAMFNTVSETNADQDLGSGGAMVLPDLTDGSGNIRHLAVGVGKDAHLYVVNRDNMGKFSPTANNIYQDITGALGGVFAMPAYFNHRIYYGAVSDEVKAFTITNATVSASATFQTPNAFGYPGATPSISANGTSNGIVWALENGGTAVLHAYDATTLNELYNSNQAASSRDHFGSGNKYVTPTIVNGKVFAPTTNSVAVFGVLP